MSNSDFCTQLVNKPFEHLNGGFVCQPGQHFTMQSIKEDDRPSVSTPFQH